MIDPGAKSTNFIDRLQAWSDVPQVFWAVLLAVTAGFVLLAYYVRAPGVTPGGDDATYMLLGQALQQGTYRDLTSLGQPFHTVYPPGFPAWIAVLTALRPASVNLVVFANCLLVAGALVTTAVIIRQLWSAWLGLAVVVACALNPLLLQFAGLTMSDSMFLALSVAALAASTRGGGRMAVLAGTAAVAGALTRSIGIALIAALFITWLLQHRWRWAGWLGVASVLVIGGWFLWVGLAPGSGNYYEVITHAPDTADRGLLAALWSHARENAFPYLTLHLPAALQLPFAPGFRSDNVAWFVVALLLGPVGVLELAKRWPTLAWYLFFYAGIMLVYTYQDLRLFVPLLPLVWLVAFLGVLGIARRVDRPGIGVASVLLVAAVAAVSSLQDARDMFRHQRACDRQDPLGAESCFDEPGRAFMAGAIYTKEHLDPSSIVVTYKYRSFTWYSGRTVVSSRRVVTPGGTVDREALRLLGVEYAFVSEVSPVDREFARALIPMCDRIQVVKSITLETHLLRFLADSVKPATNGCDALRVSAGWARIPKRSSPTVAPG